MVIERWLVAKVEQYLVVKDIEQDPTSVVVSSLEVAVVVALMLQVLSYLKEKVHWLMWYPLLLLLVLSW